MTTLEAWQHIYSNVEKEHSPQGRGGFQTLFYTQTALSEAEVEEMEGRLLYFASDIEPVKQVFFSLDSGKRVVAQLIPLSDPDRFGRKGRYLAHSLIFPAERAAELGENPFALLRAAPFISSVAEALAQGDFKTGHLPALRLELDTAAGAKRMLEAASAWPNEELKKLALLALRAEPMAAQRRAAAFFGPPERVEEALEAAFLALPTALRPRCSFDSYFYRCNLVASYYWAVGFPTRSGNPTFDQVDVQARRILQLADDYPQTAYERWVWQAIEQGNLSRPASLRDAVYPLCRWLDEGAEDPGLIEQATEPLIQAVFQANPDQVRQLLREKLGQLLPEPLVEPAFGQIYQPQVNGANFAHLKNGFTLIQLLDHLYQAYRKEQFSRPSDGEVKALRSILAEQPDHPLAPFPLLWENRLKRLQAELADRSPADYRAFAGLALRYGLVDPLALLVSEQADHFLDVFLTGPAVNLVPLNRLVARLVELEQLELLDRLTDLLTKQAGKELRRIERRLKKEEALPELFADTLAALLAALPEGLSVRKVAKLITRPLGRWRGGKRPR